MTIAQRFSAGGSRQIPLESVKRTTEHTEEPTTFSLSRPFFGGVGSRAGGIGSGGTHFSSHKSDSFACHLKSKDSFDETKFFTALKLDVEHALRDDGAQITDSGSTGSANFYFAYALKNVRGHVQVSGTQVGTDYYDVHADLDETGN